jgi:hypothetical protein
MRQKNREEVGELLVPVHLVSMPFRDDSGEERTSAQSRPGRQVHWRGFHLLPMLLVRVPVLLKAEP